MHNPMGTGRHADTNFYKDFTLLNISSCKQILLTNISRTVYFCQILEKKTFKKKIFEIHIYLIGVIIYSHGRHGRHGSHGRHGHQSRHIKQ